VHKDTHLLQDLAYWPSAYKWSPPLQSSWNLGA
jgi:hypothetical protein